MPSSTVPRAHSRGTAPVHVASCTHLAPADGVEGDARVDLHGVNVRPEQIPGAGLVHDAAAAGTAAATRGAPRVRPERVDGLDGAQLALVVLSLVALEPLVVVGKAAPAAAAAVGTLAGRVEVASAIPAPAVPASVAAAAPASSSSAPPSVGSLTLHGHTAGVKTGARGGLDESPAPLCLIYRLGCCCVEENCCVR